MQSKVSRLIGDATEAPLCRGCRNTSKSANKGSGASCEVDPKWNFSLHPSFVSSKKLVSSKNSG